MSYSRCPSPLSYSALRFPVAGILLFSAVMKAYKTAMEPVLGFPWLEIVTVEYEFLLALLLLLGIFPKIIRLITIGTFLLFLAITARLVWLSADSCGCFGKLQVEPRITLGLDLAVILTLFFAKVHAPRKLLSKLQYRLLSLGVLLTLIPLGFMGYPNPPVIVEHPLVHQTTREEPKMEYDFDYVEPLSIHRFAFEIVNPTGQNWRILSVETECDCLIALEPPVLVQANGKQVLPMEFHVPKEKQFYMKTISVATDDPGFSPLVYTIYARIGLPLKLVPDHLVFDKNHPDGEQQKIVTVVNDGAEPVRLLYSRASPSIAYARIPREPVPAQGTLELAIVFQTPKTTGDISLDLTIHTNCPEQRTLTLSVKTNTNPD